jgi:hypothetical protein
MVDKQADREAIRLLARVDKLRKELKQLEPQLSKAAVAYGKRRGASLFNEFHLRNEIERQAA